MSQIPFTVIEESTGRVVRTGFCPAEQLDCQANANERVLPEAHSMDEIYVKDTFIKLPESPSEYHVFDYEKKEWQLNEQSAWEAVRAKRNRLLAETDWSQLTDIPQATSIRYKVYRQRLRDITLQTDVINIKWPTLEEA